MMQSAVAGAGRRLINPRLPLLPPRYRYLSSTHACLRDPPTTNGKVVRNDLLTRVRQEMNPKSSTKSAQKQKELLRLHAEWQALKSSPSKPKNTQNRTRQLNTLKSHSAKTHQRGTQMTGAEATALLQFGLPKLHATLDLPTKEQYPHMPDDLVENPHKHLAQLADSGRALKATLTRVASKTQGLPRELPLGPNGKPMDYVRRTLILRIPRGGKKTVIEAAGDGIGEQSHKDAGMAAALHVISKLHKANLLKFAWSPPDVPLEAEPNGIVDVFNYAALYGCIPRCSVQPGVGRLWDVEIKMPEHGIHVTAYATSIVQAQANASHAFKRQAEAYHLREGTESFALKDMATINTENASMFLQVCQKAGEITSHQIEATEGRRAFPSAWIAQAIIDGNPRGQKVVAAKDGRAKSTKMAALIGALEIAKEKPHLVEEFKKKLSQGPQLVKALPGELYVSDQTLQTIRALNRSTADLDQRQPHTGQGTQQESARSFRPRNLLHGRGLAQKSIEMQERLASYESRPELEKLRRTRSELPMCQYERQVLEIVQNNIYCVIVGATGSGKTTQVPQILLDQAIREGKGADCNIVCTQPRRIAATSVARRVADERAERLQETVGYHVRFDSKLPEPSGSILFCTTGILLQQLQNAPDEVYDTVSHLVIDEVHERDIIIDFLLVTLKKTMAHRVAQGKRIPRVVLMSATINAEQFSEYFKDSLPSQQPTDCPSLSVPGRTFPVRERYLDDVLQELKDEHGERTVFSLEQDRDTRDYLAAERTIGAGDSSSSTGLIDWKVTSGKRGREANSNDTTETMVPTALAATTVAHIAKATSSGAILVFLPGLQDILDVEKLLRQTRPLGVNFNDAESYKLFILHSSVLDQKSVFDPVPSGCRKIILSTNIAETSVTIPDVQFVVDTGKSREKQYDQVRRMTQLQCTWISKSNVKQRAGRAGRVQNGNYYALYSKARLGSLRAVGLPELLRSELQEVCLDIKAQAFKMDVRDFLAEAIEPPAAIAVDDALKSLRGLGALTKEEELTPLGRVLASLPVHPALGKMIILGIIFRCLEPMIILGAAADGRSLIANPPGARREVNAVMARLANGSSSDHLVVLRAFYMAREAADRDNYTFLQVCNQNFIHMGAFKTVRSTATQIVEALQDAGLLRADSLTSKGGPYGGDKVNENSGSQELIKALLVAGLYPNIAMGKKGIRNPRVGYRTRDELQVGIHPSSVNVGRKDSVESTRVMAFNNLGLSSDGGLVSMRETTVVTPLMAVLFADCQARLEGLSIELDKWMPFYVRKLRLSSEPETRRFYGEREFIASQILRLRESLQKMLGIAFDSLTRKVPLADNMGHLLLAKGVARVLDDNKVDMEKQQQLDPFGQGSAARSGVSQLGSNSNGQDRQRRANRDERQQPGSQTRRAPFGRDDQLRNVSRASWPASSAERRAAYQ